MLSLKVDQNNVMSNINALLNDDKAIDLVDKIKHELGTLSSIHAKMQECETFMLQLAQATIKSEAKTESGIGSNGETDNEVSKQSEK